MTDDTSIVLHPLSSLFNRKRADPLVTYKKINKRRSSALSRK